MRILVLNGPNLNMTGKREPGIYGNRTMDEIIAELKEYAATLNCEIEHKQSNHEGVLIDDLQYATDDFDAVILNAGALTHYSYALRDAIACCGLPVAEVHLSDITIREQFRKTDVIRDVCTFCIMGLGERSYFSALNRLVKQLESKNN